jgi:hypothetical protein
LAEVTRCTTTKPILDEIDRVLVQHGLNEEALDFTINHDIKFQVGKDSDE